jgi:hypothetical protein
MAEINADCDWNRMHESQRDPFGGYTQIERGFLHEEKKRGQED